jgi:hypothetical protein
MPLDEYNLIKAPYKKQSMTAKEIEEFKKCQDPITGPQY